jgi:predicted amidohydrolase
VLECARDTGLWVILGSAHRLSGANKPHNSLYVINGAGQIVDRYDKRFCSGQDGQSGDLAHYSPGGHCSVWAINGVRCGALICYDYRFPELYREYKRSGVEIIFHSFHAANAPARAWPPSQTRSAPHSCWPAFAVRADGSAPGGGAALSFQTETGHVPPVWPAGPGDQQMMLHLDIEVDGLETAGAHAVAAGAVLAEYQPQDDVRVYLDPAGHPFCLWIET